MWAARLMRGVLYRMRLAWKVWRHQRTIAKRYAAGGFNELTAGWHPASEHINTLVHRHGPVVRARTRELVRDTPLFRNALENHITHTCGPGVTVQSQAVDADGKPNRAVQRKIETAWHQWCAVADISGKMHFNQLQELCMRQDGELGEHLVIFARPRLRRQRFALAVVDPDRLANSSMASYGQASVTPLGKQGGAVVVQGVELLPDTLERVAYHLPDPAEASKTVTYAADQVLHGLVTEQSGQVRGVSAFVPAIILAKLHERFIFAELGAAEAASRYLAFVETLDPGDFAGQFDESSSLAMADNAQNPMKADQRQVELDALTMLLLKPGERVKLESHVRPGENFKHFDQFVVRSVGMSRGQPYEILSNDYSNVNYTTLRAVYLAFRHALKRQQQRFILELVQPVYERWLDMAVLEGVLDLPGYWTHRAAYTAARYCAPVMPQVDPLKDSKAAIANLEARVTSPQQVMQERGQDPEEVAADWAAWVALAEDYGVPESAVTASALPQLTSAAEATNPAAVMEP